MNIDEIARATRKYRKNGLLILNSETLKYEPGNEAKCDRLNLLAVLEAIQKPSDRMARSYDATDPDCAADVWRTMIAELIAEVREARE